VKDQEGVHEVLEDFSERVERIKGWTEQRAAEDREQIEKTVKDWHERDLEYGKKFPDFRNRFDQLRRGYSPIIPAEDIAAAQVTIANV